MVMHFWRIDGEGYNRDTEMDEQAVVYFRKVGRRIWDTNVVDILKFKDKEFLRQIP